MDTVDTSIEEAYQQHRGPVYRQLLAITRDPARRNTASLHVSNILGKLGVDSRVEAAAICPSAGHGHRRTTAARLHGGGAHGLAKASRTEWLGPRGRLSC